MSTDNKTFLLSTDTITPEYTISSFINHFKVETSGYSRIVSYQPI